MESQACSCLFFMGSGGGVNSSLHAWMASPVLTTTPSLPLTLKWKNFALIISCIFKCKTQLTVAFYKLYKFQVISLRTWKFSRACGSRVTALNICLLTVMQSFFSWWLQKTQEWKAISVEPNSSVNWERNVKKRKD